MEDTLFATCDYLARVCLDVLGKTLITLFTVSCCRRGDVLCDQLHNNSLLAFFPAVMMSKCSMLSHCVLELKW